MGSYYSSVWVLPMACVVRCLTSGNIQGHLRMSNTLGHLIALPRSSRANQGKGRDINRTPTKRQLVCQALYIQCLKLGHIRLIL